MSYQNSFFNENLFPSLLTRSYYGNKMSRAERKRKQQSQNVSEKNGSRKGDEIMTLNGTRLKLLVLVFLFSASFTVAWFFVKSHVFALQASIVIPVFLFMALVAMWIKHNPEWSIILSPLFAILYGITLGGAFQFWSGFGGELPLYLLGMPLSILLSALFVFNRAMINPSQSIQAIVAITLSSLVVFSFYIIGAEYLFRIPIHMPYALMSSGFLFLVVLMMGVAIYCFKSDFELVKISVDNVFPKYMEWYCAFSILTTISGVYLAAMIFLINDDD